MRRYLLHLVEHEHLSAQTHNVHAAALWFLYVHELVITAPILGARNLEEGGRVLPDGSGFPDDHGHGATH